MVTINSETFLLVSEGIRNAWKERFGSKRTPSTLWKTEAALLDHFKARPRVGLGWEQKRRLVEDKLEPIRAKWAKAVSGGSESSIKPLMPDTPPIPPYTLVRDPNCDYSFIAIFRKKRKELKFTLTSYRKKKASQSYRILNAICNRRLGLEFQYDKKTKEKKTADSDWISTDELRHILEISPETPVSRYVSGLNNLMAEKTGTGSHNGIPKLIYGQLRGKAKGYYYFGDTEVVRYSKYKEMKDRIKHQN